MRKDHKLKNYAHSDAAFFSAPVQNNTVINNKVTVTTINVHPLSDPREPRFLSLEREEKKEQESTNSCCWPFSLCCGGK